MPAILVAATLADCAKFSDAAERLACFDTLLSGQAAAPVDPLVAQVRANIARYMKDPESTRIRSFSRDGDVLCGTYNAKTSMGGYGDVQLFVHVISKNKTHIIVAGGSDFNEAIAIWEQHDCKRRNGLGR